jgi:hypothetical protein
MTSPFRYLPSWPLPLYKFFPGKNVHPNKPGGHMYGTAELIAPEIDMNRAENNNFLRFSLDLYNYGYFWECHVYLEALWNTHKRKGAVADFLKGFIKLGAAGVKINLEEHELAREHYCRARELFLKVQSAEGSIFLGFNLLDLIAKIDSGVDHFYVAPIWK